MSIIGSPDAGCARAVMPSSERGAGQEIRRFTADILQQYRLPDAHKNLRERSPHRGCGIPRTWITGITGAARRALAAARAGGVARISAAVTCRRAEHLFLPPGYSIELVASEPLVQDPVAIDWDPEGRLWVVEMSGYMRNIAGSNERDPVGRVAVLQDENGDGRMDKRTVFADGLVLARAVKVLDRGVLVGEPPNAWLMRDTTAICGWTRKSWSPTSTAGWRRIRRTTRTCSIGRSTTGCTAPRRTSRCG
jgi:hypothetical protein